MFMKKKISVLVSGLLACSLLFSACGTSSSSSSGTSASSQSASSGETSGAWEPSGTITMVAAAAAGSGYDTSARQFSKLYNETGIVKQTIKVDNDAGGAGQVGYTNFYNNEKGATDQLIVASTATITGAIGNNWEVTYEDLTPICKLVVDSWVIVSKTGNDKYDSIEKVIEALKNDPSSLKIGAAAPPDPDYIGLVLFCQKIGVDPNAIQYVVYDGGGESVPALLGGDVDLCISTVGEFSSYVEAQQIKALAVASENSLSGAFEGVPTFKDLGYDFVYGNWRGIWGPSDMPAECLEYWQNASKALIETDEFKQTCDDMQWIIEPVIDDYDVWVADFASEIEEAMRVTGIIE